MIWYKRYLSLFITIAFGLVVGFFIPWPWAGLMFGAWALGLFQSYYTHRQEVHQMLDMLERAIINAAEQKEVTVHKPGRSNKRP